MGHLSERKTSFNLGEEEGLEIEMTDFDQLCHQGQDITERNLSLSAVCPEGPAKSRTYSAITQKSWKPHIKSNFVPFPTDPGAPPIVKRTGDVNTHAQTQLALLRSKPVSGLKCSRLV